jgi:hypothetical protein
MCMFSGKVLSVGDTKIFARGGEGNRQFLVYSMRYAAKDDLAMILPLPTPIASPEDAVRFIDLSGYAEFFDDLRSGFPDPQSRSAYQLMPATLSLQVHDVGSFESSFVPALGDFARLDKRFRLSDKVWKNLPQYADYGFAVIKLKPGAKKIHPMAFEFPRRNPANLFFPTVHVHNGKVAKSARFDHALYGQPNDQQCEWETSFGFGNMDSLPAKNFMQIDKTLGIVEPERAIRRRLMVGVFSNQDIMLESVS